MDGRTLSRERYGIHDTTTQRSFIDNGCREGRPNLADHKMGLCSRGHFRHLPNVAKVLVRQYLPRKLLFRRRYRHCQSALLVVPSTIKVVKTGLDKSWS